jgi:hypothetical protein
MLYFAAGMPVCFVVARDWKLRTAVRAELRERGIDALGMESADDVGRAIASGQLPGAVVVEADSELLSQAGIAELAARVPAILIASRIEKIALPSARRVLYRPVRIGEIVDAVKELLGQGESA